MLEPPIFPLYDDCSTRSVSGNVTANGLCPLLVDMPPFEDSKFWTEGNWWNTPQGGVRSTLAGVLGPLLGSLAANRMPQGIGECPMFAGVEGSLATIVIPLGNNTFGVCGGLLGLLLEVGVVGLGGVTHCTDGELTGDSGGLNKTGIAAKPGTGWATIHPDGGTSATLGSSRTGDVSSIS